jgi:hypothetical protein
MKKIVVLLLVLAVVALAPASFNCAMAQQVGIIEKKGDQLILKLSDIPGVSWPIGLKTTADSLSYLNGVYAAQAKQIADLKAYNNKKNVQVNGQTMKKVNERLALLEKNQNTMSDLLAEHEDKLQKFSTSLGLTQQDVAEMQRQQSIQKNAIAGLQAEMLAVKTDDSAIINVVNIHTKDIATLDGQNVALKNGVNCIFLGAKFPKRYAKRMNQQPNVADSTAQSYNYWNNGKHQQGTFSPNGGIVSGNSFAPGMATNYKKGGTKLSCTACGCMQKFNAEYTAASAPANP